MHCTFLLTSVWLLGHKTLNTLKISHKSLFDVHLSTAAKSMKMATVQKGKKLPSEDCEKNFQVDFCKKWIFEIYDKFHYSNNLQTIWEIQHK